MVGQAGVALGKHHGLAAAGEILQLQHRHPIALAGCHLADFGHHHHGAHLGLVGQLFEVGQGNGGEQLHWSAQLLEGVIGEVEAHQLLLQPQFLGGWVVGHRGRLGGHLSAASRPTGRRPRPGQQIKQVALAAGPVLGPGAGPVDQQIQIGHQLGAVGPGLEGIEAAGVDQCFEGPAVELVARDAIAELGQAGEGPLTAAGLKQLTNCPIAQISNRREPKQNALADGREVDARSIHIGGHHLDAHGAAVGDVALHLGAVAGIHREQGGHIGHRIVGLEVGGLIGHRAVGGGMALVEAILGEQHHLLEQGFGDPGLHASLGGALDKQALVLLHLALLLFAHGPPQQVGLAEGIAGQVLGDLHDLLLIHHDPVGLIEDRPQLFVGEFNCFAAMLAVDELGDQAGVQRPWPV